MNEKKKNNKPLIALLVVAIVGVIGFTFAYFSDKISVNNEFKTKPYGTTVTEEFVSPDNWTPGTTTSKTVIATNTGEVDEAVRISYTEEWVSEDGTILSGEISTEDDDDQNLTDYDDFGDFDDDNYDFDGSFDDFNDDNISPDNGGQNVSTTTERAAIINFDNESDWIKSTENGTDYYYYYKKIAKNESTSSLIKSVTFNPVVPSSSADNCETTTSADGKTKTIKCETTKKGYDGATYKLTFTVETVQFDQYKAAWGTNVTIRES